MFITSLARTRQDPLFHLFLTKMTNIYNYNTYNDFICNGNTVKDVTYNDFNLKWIYLLRLLLIMTLLITASLIRTLLKMTLLIVTILTILNI